MPCNRAVAAVASQLLLIIPTPDLKEFVRSLDNGNGGNHRSRSSHGHRHKKSKAAERRDHRSLSLDPREEDNELLSSRYRHLLSEAHNA